jgi:SET domain-containing protein
MNYMKNKLPRVHIELCVSKIVPGEVGVRATRPLRKGAIIGKTELLQEGEFYSWSDYKKFDRPTQKKIDAFCLGTEEGFTTPIDFDYMSIPWYLNHSCEGNVGFDIKSNFITIRPVKAGEELCYDYGLAEANPRFKLFCKCGSKKCRKIIRGTDWKNPDFRKSNIKYMLPSMR